MGAEYLSYVKCIGTYAPTFYGYIISVLASVCPTVFARAKTARAHIQNGAFPLYGIPVLLDLKL